MEVFSVEGMVVPSLYGPTRTLKQFGPKRETHFIFGGYGPFESVMN
jgi:hypothetical protein